MGDAAVEVSTTARLHLGFLDLEGGLGRRFGSVGMLLDRPATMLRLERAGADCANGPEAGRALSMLRRLVAALSLSGCHRLTIHSAIPPHAGLGSGTQLALAVAAALRRLHGLPPDTRHDAATLGRGRRSGVGVGLFDQGGLVLDGGPSPGPVSGPGPGPGPGLGAAGGLPPILSRLPVPEDWRAILVLAPAASGLSGNQESEAFAALPPPPPSDAGALCRLVVMQLLPAVVEDDLPRFGDALTRMQELLGDHFARAQGGGRFTIPAVGRAVAALRDRGATGLGQTSWGPTGFAFVRGEATAQGMAAAMADDPAWRGLDFAVCRALNRGATVSAIGTG